MGWSEATANQDLVINQLADIGFNVVEMSTWGPRSSDAGGFPPGAWGPSDYWLNYAPMYTSPEARDELFDAVVRGADRGKDLVIVPALEEFDATPTSAAYHFSTDFNQNDKLRWYIDDLVNRYVTAPSNVDWPNHWARVVDKNGVPRLAIALLFVWTTQNWAQPKDFADAFGALASSVQEDTGELVGFLLDVQANRPGYNPDPLRDGPSLAAEPSILAIQPYRSEVDAPVDSDPATFEANLFNYKRDFAQRWIATGIPFILDLTTGYDGHVVFPSGPIYGNNDWWRNDQGMIRGLGQRGMAFTAWNGFTEGWAGMETLESGMGDYAGHSIEPPDTWPRWLASMLADDATLCHYHHYQQGTEMFEVYGAICDKWVQFIGNRGVLGVPLSNESDSPSGLGRIQHFQNGHVSYTALEGLGAHETHGLIGARYAQLGFDAPSDYLGFPVTDELSTSDLCLGGRTSFFQHGRIDWCPGWSAAVDRLAVSPWILYQPSANPLFSPNTGFVSIRLLGDDGSFASGATYGHVHLWTDVVAAKNGTVLYYNSGTGAVATGQVHDDGTLSMFAFSSNIGGGYKVTAVNGSLLFFYNPNTGLGSSVGIDPANGSIITYTTMPVPGSGWTHVTGAPNGALLFYDSSSGSAWLSSVDEFGGYAAGVAVPNLGTQWTSLAAVHQNVLLLYGGSRTGFLASALIDQYGNFTWGPAISPRFAGGQIAGAKNGVAALYYPAAQAVDTFVINPVTGGATLAQSLAPIPSPWTLSTAE